jgi:hypothetical protein
MTGISVASNQRFILRGSEMWSSSSSMTSREVLPAAPVERRRDVLPNWFADISRRLDELGHLRDDWDSYGGRALDEDLAMAFFHILVQLSSVIQSAPLISMTAEGGLLAEWASPQSSLELAANPKSPVSIYYRDEETNREWEMPAEECEQIEEWLWKASSRV